MKKLIAGAAMALALATVAQAQELPARIKFGQVANLTGGGASSGYTLQLAAALAIKELNAAGGIAGKPVDIVVGDIQTDPTQTVNETRRLISQEKVHVMLGPDIGAMANAAAPLLTEAKILSYPVTGANSINPQTYPYGFATFYSSDSFVYAMVDHAVDVMKMKKIGVMVDSGGQGKSTIDTFKSYVPSKGAELVALQEYEASATDLSPQALSLRRAGAQVVVMVVPTHHAGTLYKTTEEIGWNVPIINQAAAFVVPGTVAAGGPNVFKSGRVLSLGVKAGTYCPGDAVGQTDYTKMISRLRAAYPNEISKMNLTTPSWVFDAVSLTKAAIEATKSVDGPTLAKWMESNAKNHKAITGPIAISPTYHFLYDKGIFAFIKDPQTMREDGVSLREGC
jgi:ABC-type branched-subunit amino acid transport system substrate-binding protein